MTTTDEARAALAAFADGEHSTDPQAMKVADLLARLLGVEFDPLLTSGQAGAESGLTVEGWRSAIWQGNAPAPDVERRTGCGTRRLWRRSTVQAWRDARTR